MYVVICNRFDFEKYINRIKIKIKLNEIFDPIKFTDYDKNSINIFNIHNKYKEKYKNLLNQINISNNFSNLTGYDLVTLPIDKSIFKKNEFYRSNRIFRKINKKTVMLMHGEKFSIIPLTTHINLKKIYKKLDIKNLRLKSALF